MRAPETEAEPWEVDLAFDLALEEHEDLVRLAATRWNRRTPPAVSWDELYGAGLIGLWFWAVRQDGRGKPARSYAAILINGAIGDYLRECPWLAVSLRRRRLHGRAVFLLEDGLDLGQENQAAAWTEEVEELRVALQGLPRERDREMMIDRWLRGLSLRETAERRGLTESRAAQIELKARAVVTRYYRRRDAC